jgi:phosphate acetyltransferase
MRFIESVFEKLKRHPKRIVFPEGAEPRVLEAAGRFNRMQLGAPILLGDINEIKRKADQYRVDLTRIGIVDPAKADDLEIFASRLERLQRYRNIGAGDPREILRNPNYFAAMMIQHGQADALVGGASQYASSLMRPLIQIIKPLPGITTVSSCMMMEGVPKQFGPRAHGGTARFHRHRDRQGLPPAHRRPPPRGLSLLLHKRQLPSPRRQQDGRRSRPYPAAR